MALALGIGATTAAFGAIAGAFFSRLPFPGGDRTYLLEDYNATGGFGLPIRGDEFVRRREALTSFEYLDAVHSRAVVLNSERRVTARFVTPGVLEMTETAPLMGRLPDAADAAPGAEPVILLPNDLWLSALGGDTDVVGTRIDIDGVQRTIIGVMPPGFAFPWGDEMVMATNIATVVLARNAARSGELAVRVALGASRRRVVSCLVLEVGLTVVVAAVLGLALARFALMQFEARVTGLPFWVDFGLDARVIAFTIALAGLATLVAGLLPALRTTRGRFTPA